MRSRLIALTLSLACSFLGLSAIGAAAQDPADTSVADAARRAQLQKKSAKSAKVITNDTLPATPQQGSKSLTETPPAPSPDAATQPAMSTEAAPATTGSPASSGTASSDPVDKAQSSPEATSLKQQIADQQKEVELLMRLHALDQEAFLSNPDHAKDPQGKAKLDAQQEEIHAKVAEVARLKEKLASIAPGESARVVAPKP
jgi:hypothetical protein